MITQGEQCRKENRIAFSRPTGKLAIVNKARKSRGEINMPVFRIALSVMVVIAYYRGAQPDVAILAVILGLVCLADFSLKNKSK